jgi:hypothetical protein
MIFYFLLGPQLGMLISLLLNPVLVEDYRLLERKAISYIISFCFTILNLVAQDLNRYRWAQPLRL